MIALEVAFLRGLFDAVAADRGALALAHVHESGERQCKSRTPLATLGMEYLERIDAARIHVVFCGFCLRERYGFFPCTVNSRQFQNEMAIKENPYVVIAIKRKLFIAFIFEIRLKFRSK